MRSHKYPFQLKTHTIPLALLAVTAMAYAPLMFGLGYYWDDFPMIWFAHTVGPSGMPAVFAGDRPLLAAIYWITTSFLGDSPIQWQLLGLLCRWIVALVFWWLIKLVWPRQTEAAFWTALLIAIYPGFKQQPISVIYSNGLLLLACLVFSFCLTVKAYQQQTHRLSLTIASLLLFIFCTFTTEYYVGLEITRGVLLYLLIRKNHLSFKKQLLSTIREWYPYLLILIIWLVWRVFFFKFPTYEPEFLEEMSNQPVGSMAMLAYRILNDLLITAWLAWSEAFRFPSIQDLQTLSTSLFWIVFLISAFFIIFILAKFNSRDQDSEQDISWGKEAFALGFASLLTAGWPYWITGLPIELSFPYDRFTLAFMFGASILFIGLLYWFIRLRWQRITILGVLAAMIIGSHFLNANSYRREWNTLSDFLWQLTWRVPALKQGTVIFTKELPLKYYSDNSLTAPINWTFAPEYAGDGNLPYFLAFSRVRLGRSIPELKPMLTINQGYRNLQFIGTTSDMMVIFYSPPGCLRIPDPIRDADLIIFPKEILNATRLSNLDRIIPEPARSSRPPLSIFPNEPEHGWCYYYQKAELARQKKDWIGVVQMGDEAYEMGNYPAEPSELLVLIEGYAATGNWQRALDLTNEAYRMSSSMQKPLCSLLVESKTRFGYQPDQDYLFQAALGRLDCP